MFVHFQLNLWIRDIGSIHPVEAERLHRKSSFGCYTISVAFLLQTKINENAFGAYNIVSMHVYMMYDSTDITLNIGIYFIAPISMQLIRWID